MAINSLSQIRPNSTFANFEPKTDRHILVKNGLMRLAQSAADQLQKDRSFKRAKVVTLYGGPGRGKTHLLEAFAHELIRQDLAEHIFLFRSKHTHELADKEVGNKSVLLVDDLFSDATDVQFLSTVTGGINLSHYASMLFEAYERRQLVVVSSNFPANEVVKLIGESVDRVGRIRSRIKEIGMASFELDGLDYRAVLAEAAKEAGEDPFSL